MQHVHKSGMRENLKNIERRERHAKETVKERKRLEISFVDVTCCGE